MDKNNWKIRRVFIKTSKIVSTVIFEVYCLLVIDLDETNLFIKINGKNENKSLLALAFKTQICITYSEIKMIIVGSEISKKSVHQRLILNCFLASGSQSKGFINSLLKTE